MNRNQAVLPIGIFPGGYDNLTMKRLVPAVFEQTEDVRRYCESAMAVIEDVKSSVNAFRYEKVRIFQILRPPMVGSSVILTPHVKSCCDKVNMTE